MPCPRVLGKSPGRRECGLIPGPRACETIWCDNRPETRMSKYGPTHETRPRPLAFRPGRSPGTYDRQRDLPRLLAMWPGELDSMTQEAHHRLIQRLRRALREERRRGIAGSWTYDLARHARLYRALHAEIAAMPPPLSSWVAGANVPVAADAALAAASQSAPGFSHAGRGINPGACRAPSSSPVASEPRRSSAPPSDSRVATAI